MERLALAIVMLRRSQQNAKYADKYFIAQHSKATNLYCDVMKHILTSLFHSYYIHMIDKSGIQRWAHGNSEQLQNKIFAEYSKIVRLLDDIIDRCRTMPNNILANTSKISEGIGDEYINTLHEEIADISARLNSKIGPVRFNLSMPLPTIMRVSIPSSLTVNNDRIIVNERNSGDRGTHQSIYAKILNHIKTRYQHYDVLPSVWQEQSVEKIESVSIMNFMHLLNDPMGKDKSTEIFAYVFLLAEHLLGNGNEKSTNLLKSMYSTLLFSYIMLDNDHCAPNITYNYSEYSNKRDLQMVKKIKFLFCFGPLMKYVL